MHSADLHDTSSPCRDSAFRVCGPRRSSHVGMLNFSLCDCGTPIHLPSGFLVPVLLGIWLLRLPCGQRHSVQHAFLKCVCVCVLVRNFAAWEAQQSSRPNSNRTPTRGKIQRALHSFKQNRASLQESERSTLLNRRSLMNRHAIKGSTRKTT